MSDLTPVSPEVLRHHADQHRHVPGWAGQPGHDAVCPCDSAVALLCGGCGFPLYLAVDPGRPTCEHAKARNTLGPGVVHGWAREPRGALLARLTAGGA